MLLQYVTITKQLKVVVVQHFEVSLSCVWRNKVSQSDNIFVEGNILGVSIMGSKSLEILGKTSWLMGFCASCLTFCFSVGNVSNSQTSYLTFSFRLIRNTDWFIRRSYERYNSSSDHAYSSNCAGHCLLHQTQETRKTSTKKTG